MARKTIVAPGDFSPAPIREQVKAVARKTFKSSISFLERVAQSVPYWLFVILGGAVVLSAAHTTGAFKSVISAEIFGVPVGSVGVVVIELGLLYCSFSRVNARHTGEALSRPTRILEVVLFMAAVIVNTTGSLLVVVNGAAAFEIGSAALNSHYVNGAFMTILDGLAIPILLMVVGGDVASVVYKRHKEADPFEAYWLEHGPALLYIGFYDDLCNKGMPRADASKYATALVRDTFPKRKTPEATRKAPESAGIAESNASRIAVKPGELYGVVLRLFKTDPTFPAKSRKDQVSAILGEYAVGKTAAYDCLARAEREYRASLVLGINVGDQVSEEGHYGEK